MTAFVTGEPVTETNPQPVRVLGVDTPITLTGDVIVDTLGALDDTKEIDPEAATATIPALLRGILKALNDQTALLATIASNTAP